MKYYLLKAQAKKKKWNIKNIELSDEDSLSSDEDYKEDTQLFNIINNRYIILKYLGKGTFCIVWMVYDIKLDSFFAMKDFFEDSVDEAENEQRIYNILDNKQNKSGIVKMYDKFIINKKIYIILELMGNTLMELLEYIEKQKTHIPIDILKNIIKQILLSLHELHSKKLIHTDLKLENIMLDNNSLIDKYKNYNLSKRLEDIISNNMPNNYSEFDKNKRKNIKRKIRNRSIKILCEEIRTLEISKDSENMYFDNLLNRRIEISLKIIDLGNSETFDDIHDDYIMYRNYRPIENIVNRTYSYKSDIWCVGCLLFELLTGDYLFEIKQKSTRIEKDRIHLNQMLKCLGEVPKNVSLNSENRVNLFDSKGIIKKNKNSEYVGIDNILINDYNFEKNESVKIFIFLKKMLEYDVEKRYSSAELLKDSWFDN